MKNVSSKQKKILLRFSQNNGLLVIGNSSRFTKAKILTKQGIVFPIGFFFEVQISFLEYSDFLLVYRWVVESLFFRGHHWLRF